MATRTKLNHSKEFKNEKGFTTNKQEGHWRHLKINLPIFETRKEHFSFLTYIFLTWQNLCGGISINLKIYSKFS